MRILWTLFKVMVGLAVAIPVGIVLLALTAGVFATLLGLAIVALKLACVAFVGYGLFRLAWHVLAPAPRMPLAQISERPLGDPYYEAAIRELDAELGRHPR